jgi:hypothetical protein
VSALCNCLGIKKHVPFVIVNSRTKALENYIVLLRGHRNIWQWTVWVCFAIDLRVDRHGPTGINAMDFVIFDKDANIRKI